MFLLFYLDTPTEKNRWRIIKNVTKAEPDEGTAFVILNKIRKNSYLSKFFLYSEGVIPYTFLKHLLK